MAIVQENDETWTATCEGPLCGFVTRNYPTKKAAVERLREHRAEPHYGDDKEK